jgi:2',3'-cyclic-nucleotide 2'-phosphodiesterase (5'-nucleotidase family)
MPIAYARPWRVLDVAGLRIVVLGLATSDTKNVSAGPFGDAAFEREEDTLRQLLPEARKEGDVVVLLTHCGLDADRRIARAFPEIPLILGGHSHTALQKPQLEGRTTIVQTQGKATSIYRIEGRVVPNEKRLDLVRAELVELDLAQFPEDEATAKWIADRTTDLSAKWDRVIGELVTPLLDERGTHSTAAGNLVCDALLACAGAQLSFSNKGGVRTRLRPGPLTLRQVYELLPFENTVVTVGLSGAQIRELLQANMERGKRLPDIGGGTYSYALVDGKRVLRDVTVAGAPLADDREYRVAVSSFLADGGDAFAVFKKGHDRRDHGVLVRDALVQKAEHDKQLVSDTRQRIFVADDQR